MVSSVRKKSAPVRWGERVVVEKRGDSYSLRGTLPDPRGGSRQRRISLKSRGLVFDDLTKAEEYANEVTNDLSTLSRRDFLVKWQLCKSAKEEKVLRMGAHTPPACGGVYLVRSSVRTTLETGDEIAPWQVLYVGQSSYFPDRINYAHPVFYFLRATDVEFCVEYEAEGRERERLFLEAREIAAHTPPLQFGGVPEKYKGERSGKAKKNSAIGPDDFDFFLDKLAPRSREIARCIFTTGKSFAEAKEVAGYRYKRQTLTRDLARCGCNMYQLKMGAAPQVLPDVTVAQPA
jgi:hypothetical protein